RAVGQVGANVFSRGPLIVAVSFFSIVPESSFFSSTRCASCWRSAGGFGEAVVAIAGVKQTFFLTSPIAFVVPYRSWELTNDGFIPASWSGRSRRCLTNGHLPETFWWAPGRE